jgi:hypothetical protein
VEERVQQGVRQQLIGMIDDALGEEAKRALIAELREAKRRGQDEGDVVPW